MQSFPSPHREIHKSHRAGWLRAAILGINDGIVSVSSLMLGVYAALETTNGILVAGVAGLAAGALSMAVGEYVSVSSQKDSELSDITIEKKSLAENPEKELEELAWIYEQRGLEPALAKVVAQKLHDTDAVMAHARDELGINYDELSQPLQAALASALAFSCGALVPIFTAALVPKDTAAWAITTASLLALAISGALGATLGGGNRTKASLRVLIGGGIAMLITYGIGHVITITR